MFYPSSIFRYYFNSIKVRLELQIHFLQHYKCVNFNSIKVRLEHTYFYHNFRMYIVFQFHKGAIRTNEALKVAFTGYNFNSIKVRLEHL